MTAIARFFRTTEPALVMGLVQAVVAVVISFGVRLSVDQIGGIEAAIAALSALIVRAQVTPTAAGPAVPAPAPPAAP